MILLRWIREARLGWRMGRETIDRAIAEIRAEREGQ